MKCVVYSLLINMVIKYLSCKYGAYTQKFPDDDKYLKPDIGQKLKYTNSKDQFIGKHVLEKHQEHVF